MGILATVGSPLLVENRRPWTWAARATCYLRVPHKGRQKREGRHSLKERLQCGCHCHRQTEMSDPFSEGHLTFALETLVQGLEVGGGARLGGEREDRPGCFLP